MKIPQIGEKRQCSVGHVESVVTHEKAEGVIIYVNTRHRWYLAEFNTPIGKYREAYKF